MSKRLQAGQVEIILQGETRRLVPTLKAAYDLSRKHRGFRNLSMAIFNRDLDAFADVIEAGLDAHKDERPVCEGAVYEAGFVTGDGTQANAALLEAVDRYVAILQNGGRPLEDQDEEAASGEADGG